MACIAALLAGLTLATSQTTYSPGIKLLILRANPPLPERPVIEHALRTFSGSHGFTAGPPLGRSSIIFGKDPDISLVGTFAPSYVNVVLWTDSDDHQPHLKDVSDLLATMLPFGFQRLPEIPVDPD